ncbi:MAG: hypothetical protein LBG07_01105 [Treponema sp.]|jgi:hypothetical protein|nr:hypothetical protein [Treponema sp.]
MRYFFSALRKILFLTGILLAFPLPAQVNQEELEQNQAPITFINYEGPHARIESRAQIRNIGYVLGQAVRGGNNTPGTRGRYFVIHIPTPGEGGRLNADIFGLGHDTGVDHIRNLRLILQGYLEGAYLYSAEDATLLAEYVTIYNAVYRGDWGYIGSRYQEPVTGHLDRERAGLSIRFDEWPGRTLLIIPMGIGGAGSLSALDTSVISDSRVVEELRKDEDRGVEQRQDMVELKEREAEEAEQRAGEQRREAADEQRQIDEERQRIDEERQRIEEQRRIDEEGRETAQGQPSASRETPREPGSRPAGERPPVTAEESPQGEQAGEEELARREEDLERRQEAVDQKQEEARRNEELAEQKREEAWQEREDIAADQQALINEGSPREEEGLIAVILNGPDSPLGRFVYISREGEELRRSAVNTVNVRSVLSAGGRIIAIAGENRGSGAVRLIEIDGRTLEMKAQGRDDIHPQSLLWTNGPDLYAIIASGGNAYLGRFNSALGLEARSQTALHPFASLWFQDDLVLTQRADGSALILNAQTLGE